MAEPFRALTLFGANWDTPNTTGTFVLSLTLTGIMHWWWRVNEVDMVYSFTDSVTGGVIANSVTFPKEWNVMGRPAVSLPEELIGNQGYGVAPYYIDSGTDNQLGLFYNRVVPQNFSLDQWRVPLLIHLSHESVAPGFTVESAQTLGPTQPTAGTWNLNATDPITSEVYDLSGTMYVLGGSVNVTGSVTITPHSYYSYDGKYNTVTGALI